MKKAIIYIHGKGGNHLEAESYKKNCPGFDIIGLDYEVDFPWIVIDKIKNIYEDVKKEYEKIYIIANSIGVYFTMLSLKDYKIEKALFISPILDMERLILDMMTWANVTEQELSERGEINTDFGEILSWEYLSFARKNKINWKVPTEILYAENDNLTSLETVNNFVKNHNANLTIMENGEHWFHTEEQISFLDDWMKKSIK